MKRIAVLPGDGIGVDVTREAVKVLQAVTGASGRPVALDHFDHGAEKYLATGITMPPEDMKRLGGYDAILLGALGDPRIPDMRHGRDILLGMRFQLDLYINFRPVRCLHDDLCPLKGRRAGDIDFVVFRENTEGAYVGMGGIFKKGTPDEIAVQEDVNTRKGVERIIRAAFEYARRTGRKSVCMSDKSNALSYGHDLWQRVFAEVRGDYPEIEPRHLFIDALVMQMIKDPSQFDVIVTCNMFGDIATDLGAILQGGLGMAASGNIHPGGAAMFEPVHGSAPKYAGRNVANPFGAILTVALLLDHVGYAEEARRVEEAVARAIAEGRRPRELGGNLGTAEAGDAIARLVAEGR